MRVIGFTPNEVARDADHEPQSYSVSQVSRPVDLFFHGRLHGGLKRARRGAERSSTGDGGAPIGRRGGGAVGRPNMDVIGNNIANAATEGYHRQRLELGASNPNSDGTFSWGRGVEINGIGRTADKLLESEVRRQTSSIGTVEQELNTLSNLQTTFGELTVARRSTKTSRFSLTPSATWPPILPRRPGSNN